MTLKTKLLIVCLLAGMAWISFHLIPGAVVRPKEPEPIPTPPPPPGRAPAPLGPIDISTSDVSDALEIRIKAYLHDGVNEGEYRSFVDRITGYYQGQGLSVRFLVNEVVQLGATEECGWSRGENDVINCVGPGMGGYYGPPWYRIDVNTNYGFDTDWGLHSACHEYGHFLGVQDLYWLQTTEDSPYHAPAIPWPDEIMFNPYHDSPVFSYESRRVISDNLQRIRQGGVENMILVADRMAAEIEVVTPLVGDACDVYSRQRDYDLFGSRMDSISSLTQVTDGEKRFRMETIGDDNSDGNFDLYYLSCDSGAYWIHSRLVEDAYFASGEAQIPVIECETDGGWCRHTPEYIVYLPIVIRK